MGEHLDYACLTFRCHIDHGQIPARLVTRPYFGGERNWGEPG
jgi:hypothetical protein